MPNAAYWRCSACARQLGQVRRDGSLEILAGGRVLVPAVAAADVVVIAVCPSCAAQRRWSPRPPHFEVKSGPP